MYIDSEQDDDLKIQDTGTSVSKQWGSSLIKE